MQESSELLALPDWKILALTIYGEARGEHVEGQIAVGCVIRNRCNDSRWPDTIGAVCLQRKQFSCWNRGDPNREELERLSLGGSNKDLDQCEWVAKGIVSQALLDRSNGANHYHTVQLHPLPVWARAAAPVLRLRNHVFYKL